MTISAYALSADGLTDPITVAQTRPLLSWKFRAESDDDPQPESARVQAAFSREELRRGEATAWDTGWLETDNHFVEWAGAELGSRSRVFWRVAIGDQSGPGAWSDIAEFELALLDGDDWVGKWVTHPEWVTVGEDPEALPVVAFDVPPAVDLMRARLYIAGAGVFTVQVNGVEITDDVLAPGYSAYDLRVGARAYDVTAFLSPARATEVVIGLGTGAAYVGALEGRYSKFVAGELGPRVLAQVEVTDGSGSTTTTATTGAAITWLGETTLTHWFGGEDYDARREATCRDAAVPAVVLGEAGLHSVWWPQYPAIRPTERLRPVGVRRTPTGRIYDFGTNSAGAPILRLVGAAAGRTIRIWPSELLVASGDRIAQTSTGSPLWDTYITRDGDQAWQPRYVYHGFRYLFVEGLEDQDGDDGISAVVFHARNRPVGDFASSHSGLTKLHSMIVRALESNMFSVFTDCPHREKLGWLEEVHLVFPTMVQAYDLRAHLRDTVQHIIDAQLPDGSVPNIAPEFVNFAGNPHNGDPEAFRFDPNWGSALVHLPWGLYETYEDVSSLRLAWSSIVRYLDHLSEREGADGLLDFGLGDWIALDQSTPRVLAANHGYARTLDSAARIAAVLGHDQTWTDRADRVRTRLAAIVSPDGVSWGTDNQASLALALDGGLVADEHRAIVVQRLVDRIEADGYAVTLGEIALPALVRVLSSAGRDDILLRLVENVDGAGYGHQIASDETTLAEAWIPTGDPEVEGSQNHFMLGMIDDWLRERVAGLAQAPGSTGWRRITVDPALLPGIDAASIRFDSPRGEIRVEWDAAGGGRQTPRIHLPPGITLASPTTSELAGEIA